MERIPRLNRKGWGRKHRRIPGLIDLGDVRGPLNLADSLVTEIMQRLPGTGNDYKVAERVAKIIRERWPDATIPEAITADWLEQQDIQYTYQAWLYANQGRTGNLIPDFVLYHNGVGLAWLVQGNYWHMRPGKEEVDMAAKQLLMGTQFHYVTIDYVVELWENKIYYNRPAVFEFALMGQELGR